MRLSSPKVFVNVGNLGRHKKQTHHGLYHFSVSYHSTDVTRQPSRTTKIGRRQDAQLLNDNTAALIITNSLTHPLPQFWGPLLSPIASAYSELDA